jgi:hypothetical protein
VESAMKYLVTFTVVGLHLPPMLMAFTATTCKVHDRCIFANERLPTTLFNALDHKNAFCSSNWEAFVPVKDSVKHIATNVAVSTMLGMFIPMVAFGVSGGGLDYANLDISSQNFSGGNYKGKDFTQGLLQLPLLFDCVGKLL